LFDAFHLQEIFDGAATISSMDVEDYLILDDNSKNVRYEYLDEE
jgi:hypothetical protein